MYKDGIPKRYKEKIKHHLMLFMVLLMVISSLLPSAVTIDAETKREHTVDLPKVSKDVDGKNQKEITEDEDFEYNIKVEFTEDLKGYESLIISDLKLQE